MKKVININFQGRVVPIEESAYDALKQYIDSLSKFFANEEGKEEIINDIEGRIAELFAESLKKGNTCIEDDTVENIINSIGRPKDFEAEEGNVKQQLTGNDPQQFDNTQSTRGFTNISAQAGQKLYRNENQKVIAGVCSGVANYFNTDPTIIRILTAIFFGVTFIPYLILWVVVPSSATQQIGSTRKRLFRNPDENIIAGVCSGLAHYFGISVWIPRLLFLLPFISFVFKMKHFYPFGSFPHFINFTVSPGAIVIYVILWVILPEALTTADKLEMKGEKIDLNSIKNTIQNDLEGVGKRVNEWGKNVGQGINEKAQQFNEEFKNKSQQYSQQNNQNMKKNGNTFGDVLITIFKVIAYTIIGSAVVSIIIALFAGGVTLTGLLPVKDYLIKDGWQNICAWGTLLFFIWIPVIGAITFIIRRLAKVQRKSNVVRWTFGGLWTAGWVFMICFIASLANDFKYGNTPSDENVFLENPSVQKLEIKTSSFNKYYHWDWLNIEPFGSFEEDTAFVKNYRVRIIKSSNDSFHLSMVKFARGENRKEANILAEKINFTVAQTDSVLKLSKGIAINKKDKFRNQRVVLTIAVPIGKRIKVNSEVYWSDNTKISFGNDDWDEYTYKYYRDDESYNYRSDVEYIMTVNGLKKVKDSKAFDNDDEENNNNENETDKLEKYKESREVLRLQIEEEKRNLEEQKRKLEEKEREYKKNIDSSIKQNTTLQKPSSTNSDVADIFLSKYSI